MLDLVGIKAILSNLPEDPYKIFEIYLSGKENEEWKIRYTKKHHGVWICFLAKQVGDEMGMTGWGLITGSLNHPDGAKHNDNKSSDAYKQKIQKCLNDKTIPTLRQLLDILTPLVSTKQKGVQNQCRYIQANATPLNMKTIYLLAKMTQQLGTCYQAIDDLTIFDFIKSGTHFIIKVKGEAKARRNFHVLCKLQEELHLTFPSEEFANLSQKQKEFLDGIEISASGKEQWGKNIKNTLCEIFDLALEAKEQYENLLELKKK